MRSVENWLLGQPSLLHIPEEWELLERYCDLIGVKVQNEEKHAKFFENYITKLATQFIELKEEDVFVLRKEEKEIFCGTESECLYRLQEIQSCSYDHATKYEGYSISEINELTINY